MASFPVAIQKATAKEVIEYGWKQSGLYPFHGQTLLDTLRDGPPYRSSERNIPLIAGKILINDDVIGSIKTLECRRNQTKTMAEQQKQREEVSKLGSNKRTETYLNDLRSTLPAGPGADAWIPKLTAAIKESQVSIKPLQSIETPFPTANPPYTTDLQFSTSTILLPALDNSTVDEQMESETKD